PLSLILRTSPVAPAPLSPVVHEGYRRRFIAVSIVATVLWFLSVSGLAFISVPTLIAADGSVIDMVMEMTGYDLNQAGSVFITGFLIGLPLIAGAGASVAPLWGYVRRLSGFRVRSTTPRA